MSDSAQDAPDFLDLTRTPPPPPSRGIAHYWYADDLDQRDDRPRGIAVTVATVSASGRYVVEGYEMWAGDMRLRRALWGGAPIPEPDVQSKLDEEGGR